MPEYFIGTSGWYYPDWRQLFYPDKLPKSQWLGFYSQHFNTVELNNTFYRLPPDKTFNMWQSSVPAGFIYAVKVSRFITHIKRLKNLDDAVDKFISRVKLLKQKLGPLLYQLPPRMKKDKELLTDFLTLLPRNYKHVFEFRDTSWLSDDIYSLLNEYGAGFCVYDMPEYSTTFISTADFAYFRFHGSRILYGSNYSQNELLKWAESIKTTGRNLKTIYVYFNNDYNAFAVNNAAILQDMFAI